ncbi:MAG: hypothetical protein ABIR17_01905 [Pseudolysinimonas sp.]|uniref:hypothetical protein n=1 Tax=Pseudolysinimonas sp. TaxID=2680009 RepID=UPI0032651038
MRNILHRTVAAVTALIIGAAGLAVGVAPAAADPGGILWMGGPGVSPASPYASDHVTLSVNVQGPSDSPCSPANAPTLSWDDGDGRAGTLPPPGFDGISLVYVGDLGTFPAGDTTVTVTASGGCAQPADSGIPPTVAVYSFTVIADPPWPPANDSLTISGTVRQVHDGVATPLRNTTVGLYYAGVGAAASEPLGPLTTTDSVGRYTVSLYGDVGGPDVVLAVFPADSAPVFYRAGATAASGSATTDLTATVLSAATWDTSALYDVYVDYGYTPVAGGWPSIPTQHLTAGITEYDERFVASGDFRDSNWNGTITVDGLPPGLDARVLQPGGIGTPFIVWITGTPLRDGTATVRLSGVEVTGAILYTDVEFVVAAPVCSQVFDSYDLSFHDTATRWLGLCRYDATLRDALGRNTSRASDAVGAFAGMGEIRVNGARVWAEAASDTFDDDGDRWSFIDYDVDAGHAGLVDVAVVRAINGSTAVWTVTAYVAGTSFGTVATDAWIELSGTIGSNGSPAWFAAGPASLISTDTPGSGRPVIVHGTNGTFAHAVTGDPDLTVAGDGSLTYTAAIVDYSGCAYRSVLDTVTAGAAYILDPAHAGQEFSLEGEECVPIWDGTDVVAHVGDTIDVTVRAIADGPFWDFGLGGTSTADFSDVTGGLNAELVDQGSYGVGPGVRIWGTVTAEGEFGIPITATDGVVASGVTAWVHLLPTLPGADPEKSMSIDLDAEIGDIVAGTEVNVNGTGLADPSTWDIVVHSTPQLIGSGSAGAGGTIATAATIPAGLEAGWHSVTFTGTWFDATAATAVLWFQLDSAGRLIATSRIQPVASGLAATGSVQQPSDGLLGLLLLVAGLAMVASQRRTRRLRRIRKALS